MNFFFFKFLLKLSFPSDATPTTALELALTALKNVSEGNIKDEDNEDYLLTTSLPKFVRALLVRKSGDKKSVKENINRFFLAVLDLFLEFIERDIREIASSASLITSSQHTFYKNRERLAKDQANQTIEAVKEFFDANPVKVNGEVITKDYAKVIKQDSRANSVYPYYIINLNYFGRRGGFEAILRRIEDQKDRPNMSTVAVLMRVLENVLSTLYFIPP